ncbi:MAG: hypothetical protein K0Q86_1625 [Arthrobacter koreensis]|jgi:hypothetical protein|uniref:hypothetical protein n=1 Tax=Arthrobacter koreensis TaxID=199136 RepID=UPI00240A8EAB|nr:hypothetical protein [Arthrobacter koreensis]MDF2497993.1 hypothetical protein [Arthrobacter koreensis]
MTFLQKALSPAQVEFLVGGNRDTVSGFVVNAGDAVNARTPEDLFAVHCLDFPGSPWDRGAGYVDVLRFQVPLSVYVHDAADPEFVDRPPFTGTGFAAWSGGVVPSYFLDECAIPPGAELWRIRAGQPEELIAVYFEVATGWGVSDASGISRPGTHTPSHIMGWSAVWQGQVFRADLVNEGRSVEVAATSDPGVEGFERTPKGVWRRTVGLGEIQDFYELLATCSWQGEPFRITDVAQGEDGQVYRLFYTGHNADRAEALGLNKADAGVYWTVVPESQVQDVQVVQNRLPSLAFRG